MRQRAARLSEQQLATSRSSSELATVLDAALGLSLSVERVPSMGCSSLRLPVEFDAEFWVSAECESSEHHRSVQLSACRSAGSAAAAYACATESMRRFGLSLNVRQTKPSISSVFGLSLIAQRSLLSRSLPQGVAVCARPGSSAFTFCCECAGNGCYRAVYWATACHKSQQRTLVGGA